MVIKLVVSVPRLAPGGLTPVPVVITVTCMVWKHSHSEWLVARLVDASIGGRHCFLQACGSGTLFTFRGPTNHTSLHGAARRRDTKCCCLYIPDLSSASTTRIRNPVPPPWPRDASGCPSATRRWRQDDVWFPVGFAFQVSRQVRPRPYTTRPRRDECFADAQRCWLGFL